MKYLKSLAFIGVLSALQISCITLKSQHEAVVTGVNGNQGPEVRDASFQARGNDTNPRKRILVLPFIDATGGAHSDKLSKNAREALIRGLNRAEGFVIVSNADFPKDIATYFKNGEYDLEEMSKLGLNVGVAGIIEGKILDVKAKKIGDEVGIVREVRAQMTVSVQLKVIATKTSHMIVNEMRKADVEDSSTHYAERAYTDKDLSEDPNLVQAAVIQAFSGTVPKIVSALEKLSWEGRVALVKGERIFLNAGRLSGLQVGDILKVEEDGEDVFDPETGALIGKVPGRVKGTVEVVSYFGKDGAISVLHSGSGFKENDLVELY